jgi:hypothetical protein
LTCYFASSKFLSIIYSFVFRVLGVTLEGEAGGFPTTLSLVSTTKLFEGSVVDVDGATLAPRFVALFFDSRTLSHF